MRPWRWLVAESNPPSFTYAAQVAVGSVSSYVIAHWFGLPEAYWAPMAALIVMQSTFEAALPVSALYLAGTAIGATIGALAETYFRGSLAAFCVAIYLIGLACVVLRLERSAYRYAGVTLMIVMLVPRSTSAPATALHRFLEVSIGIATGLLIFALWENLTSRISSFRIRSSGRPTPPSPGDREQLAVDAESMNANSTLVRPPDPVDGPILR